MQFGCLGNRQPASSSRRELNTSNHEDRKIRYDSYVDFGIRLSQNEERPRAESGGSENVKVFQAWDEVTLFPTSLLQVPTYKY